MTENGADRYIPNDGWVDGGSSNSLLNGNVVNQH